jgi:hypothetical protein
MNNKFAIWKLEAGSKSVEFSGGGFINWEIIYLSFQIIDELRACILSHARLQKRSKGSESGSKQALAGLIHQWWPKGGRFLSIVLLHWVLSGC